MRAHESSISGGEMSGKGITYGSDQVNCRLVGGWIPVVLHIIASIAVVLFALGSSQLRTAYAQSQAVVDVDVQLVLAVDISLSMDSDEQRLQREGYVAAFKDPALVQAILAGRHKRIAVTYFEWAGEFAVRTLIPWTIVDSAESAYSLSESLAAMPFSRARFTSISGALNYASGQFEESPFRSDRRVLDISGDGPNNNGPPVSEARQALLDKGVVINGLPIVIKRGSPYFELSDLEQYYRDCVIGGEGAFVIPIRSLDEFLSATRLKLLREIAEPLDRDGPIIRVGSFQEVGTTDCLIGEKLLQRYLFDRFENR